MKMRAIIKTAVTCACLTVFVSACGTQPVKTEFVPQKVPAFLTAPCPAPDSAREVDTVASLVEEAHPDTLAALEECGGRMSIIRWITTDP